MKLIHSLAAISLAAQLIAPGLVLAGDGHGHGEAPPAASGTALPRFAAASDLFELVGVLHGKQLTLYLDHAAANTPVTEAQIELEIAGQKFTAAKHGSDEFEVVLPAVPPAGVLPITATVIAGGDTDLLAAELDIHDAEPDREAAGAVSWLSLAAGAAGGITALAVLTFAARRLAAVRQARLGGAA